MRKILIGLVGVVLVGAGGYFGANLWAKQRVEKEVEAAFAAIRSRGGSATHGAVRFDLASRTVSVADITVETPTQPGTLVKIGRVAATGVSQPAPGRISANRVEIANVEIGGVVNLGAAGSQDGGMRISYKAPRIELVDYSGPAAPLRPIDTSSAIDLMRFSLEHFIAATATSATIPTLTFSLAGDGSSGLGSAEYAYSGIAVGNVRDGRVASMTVDRTTFTSRYRTANEPRTVEGEITTIVASDFDANVMLAALASTKTAAGGYQRVYRQISAGPYKISVDKEFQVQIDTLAIEDLAFDPAKYPIADLIALLPVMQRPQAQISPADISAVFDVVATFYEGTRIDKVAVRGLSATIPTGAFKLAALNLGRLENGRLAEFVMEGLSAQTPQQETIRVARFAVQGMKLADFMRTSAAFTTLHREPLPHELIALLRLLDGADLAGLAVPYKDKKIEIDTAAISWGQFVGQLPTSVRTKLRLSMPIEISDEDLFRRLAAAGFKALKLDFDLGAAWTEKTQTFAFVPATMEFSDLFSASAKVTVANVSPDIFFIDPVKFAPAAMTVEAGPVELVVRDLGAVEMALTQFAREQGIPPAAARRAILEQIEAGVASLRQTNPDLVPVVKALASFVEQSRGTLTIRITPKTPVLLMPLIEAVHEDPVAALAQVKIEAAISR
jgi:hypothetical protein